MKRLTILLVNLIICSNVSYTQESDQEFSDRYLSGLFKTFYSVDTEIANCMAPIIEERLVSSLDDPANFKYPFKKLSEYVTIRRSEDSLVKTLSWDRINGGSWHDYASYIQYKTKYGEVKYQRLDSGDEFSTGEPTSVTIYDISEFKVKSETYYILMGYGTYGGGKKHILARAYKIKGNELALCDAIFQGEKYLYIGANRGAKINLEFNPESKTLSFDYYEFDGDVGFYKGDSRRVTLVFENGEFVEQKN
ncbi:hypothetical protein [Winogradskyella sp. 3972H.M.0a.05]|uniref:hypothetical protein n=1 Tax=Winogradskyella sp. 3972H.M.0a.05 TaxID=2950277 RepID=UPI00339099AD